MRSSGPDLQLARPQVPRFWLRRMRRARTFSICYGLFRAIQGAPTHGRRFASLGVANCPPEAAYARLEALDDLRATGYGLRATSGAHVSNAIRNAVSLRTAIRTANRWVIRTSGPLWRP